MRFTCEIDMDNAAFDDTPATELARILEAIAERARDDGQTEDRVHDYNGNTVGQWEIKP